MAGLALVFKRRSYRYGALIVALLYVIIYLLAIENIVYLPGVNLAQFAPIPSVQLAQDWAGKLFKARAPFIWEPIGVFYISSYLMVMLAVPNLLIALLLGELVGMNLAIGLYGMFALGGFRGAGSWRGLLGALPGLLTGFACCAPTFLIALGSAAAGITAGVITVRPFLIPLSIVILVLSLLWSAGRIAQGNACSLPGS
jgi:hypothetical protein